MVEPTGAPATEPTGPPGAEPTGAAGAGPGAPLDPGRVAIGTWSGGRFMHFGEPLDDERLLALIRPDEAIATVLTADVYGDGRGRRAARSRARGRPRDSTVLVGAVGHDFYRASATGAKGFPRFTDPRLRGPAEYGDYLRMATERSLERCGVDASTCCCCTTPTAPATRSEAVWDGDGGAARRRADAADRRRPGPANGFTLDLIDCLERFGA